MCLLQTAINPIFFILILMNAICCLELSISITSNSIILNENHVINRLYFDFVLLSRFLLQILLFNVNGCFKLTNGPVMVVIVWQLTLQLPVKSVPISTKVVSSNHVHGEVYLI